MPAVAPSIAFAVAGAELTGALDATGDAGSVCVAAKASVTQGVTWLEFAE
jgi:hypothetical protein